MIPRTVSSSALLWAWGALMAVGVWAVPLSRPWAWNPHGFVALLLTTLVGAGALLLWRWRHWFRPIDLRLFAAVFVTLTLLLTILDVAVFRRPWGYSLVLSALASWPFVALSGVGRPATGFGPPRESGERPPPN